MKIEIAALLMVIMLTACTTQRGFPPEHQIVNFDKVDDHLYRGAQPNHNGLEYLASRGIKTVINLRQTMDSLPDEERVAKQLGMTYVNVPLSGTAVPSIARMQEIQALIAASPQPVFVHCQYGCDRTGITVACWRIDHGWTVDQALAEAKKYGISPLLVNFKDFVRRYAHRE